MKISLLDSATFGDFFELEKASYPCEWQAVAKLGEAFWYGCFREEFAKKICPDCEI